MQPNILGPVLRQWRDSSGLGPIKLACGQLGVSHSTLGMYERGELLPDVDFLATFAERTGADFQELLRLRLAGGKTSEARKLALAVVDREGGRGEPRHPAYAPSSEPSSPGDGPQVAAKALNEKEIDGELLATIVARMERALLQSEALWRVVYQFVSASAADFHEFSEALAKGPDALLAATKPIPGLGGVVGKIAGPLIEFAAVEAALAARIYNKVVLVTDPSERDALIDGEVRFYVLLRTQLLREAS